MKTIKSFVIPIAVGAMVGAIFGLFILNTGPEKPDLFTFFIHLFAGFIGLVLSFVLHIFIHEIGHLIAGKISGYSFVSIRFFNVMFIKKDGQWERKKYNLVGAPGQCLMCPPEPIDGKFPFILYNLGGALMNIIFGGLALASYFVFPIGAGLWWVFIPFAFVGIIVGIINIIPLSGTVPNDGHNIVMLGKNEVARRAFWLVLYINAQITKGLRFRDVVLQEQLDFLNSDDPNDEHRNNSVIASARTFQIGWLMDMQRFKEAKNFIEHFLKSTEKLPEIYKNELNCELLFLELIDECRKEEIERLYTEDLQKYIKATASYMSRQRLLYAYFKLFLNDETQATKTLEKFNKTCTFTPLIGEIAAERELIELVDNLANNRIKQ